MPTRGSPLLDEVSRLVSDAAGMARGVRREAETIARAQIERALAFGEQTLIIEKGRIAWEGTVAALKADHTLIETYLGVGIR